MSIQFEDIPRCPSCPSHGEAPGDAPGDAWDGDATDATDASDAGWDPGGPGDGNVRS